MWTECNDLLNRCSWMSQYLRVWDRRNGAHYQSDQWAVAQFIDQGGHGLRCFRKDKACVAHGFLSASNQHHSHNSGVAWCYEMLQGLSMKGIFCETSQPENKTTVSLYLFYLASSEILYFKLSLLSCLTLWCIFCKYAFSKYCPKICAKLLAQWLFEQVSLSCCCITSILQWGKVNE